MSHSERIQARRDMVIKIQASLEMLLKCKEAGNLKQIAYWVGKLSRDVSDLCRDCLGEELLKKMAEKKERIIH